MARDFNTKVIARLRQQQQLGRQGNSISIKTLQLLACFDRMMAQEIACRNVSQLMEALAGWFLYNATACRWVRRT